jgi:hypothetical protein
MEAAIYNQWPTQILTLLAILRLSVGITLLHNLHWTLDQYDLVHLLDTAMVVQLMQDGTGSLIGQTID